MIATEIYGYKSLRREKNINLNTVSIKEKRAQLF